MSILEAANSTFTSTVILTDDLLHCPNCTGELVRPKLLPCLHSFCYECLDTCLSENQILPGQTFYCPLCKSHCTVPDGGVDRMKENILAVSMQNFLNFRNEVLTSDDVTCNGCGLKSLVKSKVKKCVECNDWLCKSCCKVHQQVKVSRNHHLFSSEDLLTGNHDNLIKENVSSHFCPKHHERFSTFCLESKCKALLCPMCRNTSHNNHDVIPINEQAAKDFESIQSFLPLVERSIATLQARINNLSKQQKNVIHFRKSFHKLFGERVLLVIEKLTSKLQEHANKLHTTVDDLTSDRLDNLAKYDVEGLKAQLEAAKISTQFSENLLRFDYLPSTITMKDVVKNQLERFQICPEMKIPPWTQYSLSDNGDVSFEIIAHYVGRVYCDDKPKNDSSTFSFNVKFEIDLKPCVISDLAIDHLMSSIVVVDECNKNIKVFDFEGNPISGSSEGFFISPIRVTVLRNNMNYLVNDGNTLKLSSKQFDSLKLFTSYKFKQPVGVTQSTNGEILVAEWMTGEILGFDEVGNRVRNFPCLSRNPAYLVCCPESDHVIISDWKTHSIRIFHWNGNLIGIFGNKQGSEMGQLDHPHGVCSDPENKIIVCDSWNNRLLLLDWKGRYIKTLLSRKDGLRWPQAVALMRNYIFVVERQGVVKLFNYNPC